MFKFSYNLIILLFAVYRLLKAVLKGKSQLYKIKERLGLILPHFESKGPTIWIHAISVGETRAILPLVNMLRRSFPQFSLVFSSATETGQAEAKRSLPPFDLYFLLPLDTSWTIKRIAQKINPHLLILVEGDFWFNLIDSVEQVLLVNGKISKKSFKRFLAIPFFSKKLFSKIKILCVQNEEYAHRFAALGVDQSKIVVTGNIKFDSVIARTKTPFNLPHWKQELAICPDQQIITIASTHFPEEKMILSVLIPLMKKSPHLKWLLAPRRLETLKQLRNYLTKMRLPYANLSSSPPDKIGKSILIIDSMGVLDICFELSEVAIIGGSFIRKVGGHNILEPVIRGTPVLYGPYMKAQTDLVQVVTEAKAGLQLSLKELPSTLENLLNRSSPQREYMSRAGVQLVEKIEGATHRTVCQIEQLLSGLNVSSLPERSSG